MVDRSQSGAGTAEVVQRVAAAMGTSAVPLALLGLSPSEDAQILRRHATTGLIDCFPFAQVDAAHSIALRAVSTESDAGPVVALTNVVAGESAVIAESAATWLPIWIVTQLLVGQDPAWDRWNALDETDWELLRELHRHHGGGDDLSALRKVVGDKSTRDVFTARSPQSLAAFADTLSRVAPGDHRGMFQRDLDILARERWLTGYAPAAYGNWCEPMIVAAGAMARPPEPSLLAQTLVDAVRQPSNHDAEWCHLQVLAVLSDSASSNRGGPVLTARVLVKRVLDDGSDSWRAATERLAAAGAAYDGRAHVDLVQRLHTSGETQQAFQACLTASFWIFKSQGRVPAELQVLTGRLARDLPSQGPWAIVSRGLQSMGVKV